MPLTKVSKNGVSGSIWTPDSTMTTADGLVIKTLLLTKNNPNKISLPAKMTKKHIGVTLHNTATLTGSLINAGLTTPAEQYVRATINGNMGTVVVHYYVDEHCAWECYPETHQGWHAATGGNGPGNGDTISIEACGPKATENAAKLIAHLFKKHGWTTDKNLFTHNYWTNYLDGYTSGTIDQRNTRKVTSSKANSSGKYCPAYILPEWNAFKQLVTKYTTTKSNEQLNAASKDPAPSNTTSFAIGSSVTIKAGASDKNGRKCSTLYAGANKPLTVKAKSGTFYTLYVGNTPMYVIAAHWLTPAAGTPTTPVTKTFEVGKSLVRLKANAVWWNTKTSAINGVTRNTTYYLQQLNRTSNRAVIGTTPKSSSNTTTGAVDIKYLELV